jgi:hypothetical protein
VFILYLGLMCDDLQELSELSLNFQERNLDLNKAYNKIVCLVNVFNRGENNQVHFIENHLK